MAVTRDQILEQVARADADLQYVLQEYAAGLDTQYGICQLHTT